MFLMTNIFWLHSALFNSGHKNHHFWTEKYIFLAVLLALLRTYSATPAREINIFQGKNTFLKHAWSRKGAGVVHV